MNKIIMDRLEAPRAQRLAWFAAVIIGVLVVAETIYLAAVYLPRPGQVLGNDYHFYRDVGVRWLANGSYYLPEQLAGPYDLRPMFTVLYPPTALLLFVPFGVLPWVLWWAVPIALLGYALWTFRPAAWAWVVMLTLMAWPHAIGSYLFGNTDMWATAFIALGLRFGWPAVLVALKPLYLPFALVGARRRSFWVAGVMLGAFSLLMFPLWKDYSVAMTNIRIDASYWLLSIPLLSIPLVAWRGRTDRRSHRSPLLRADDRHPEPRRSRWQVVLDRHQGDRL